MYIIPTIWHFVKHLALNKEKRKMVLSKEEFSGLSPRDQLRLLREKKGLTQAQLASETGISLAQVSRFENGLSISAPVAIKLAKYTGLPLEIWYQ